MIRIWLTDYDINPETGWGAMCGPDIQAPSEKIANAICRSLRKQYKSDLRVIGWLVMTVPEKEEGTFIPDWEKAIDYETIWMN